MARRPRSLRLELVATLTVVLMMAVVSLSLAAELLGRQRYDDQQRLRLADHTRSLAAIIEPLLDPSAPAGLRGGPVEQVLRPSVGSMGIEAIEIHRIDRTRPKTTVLVSLGLGPALPPPAAEASGQPIETDGGVLVVDRSLRVFGPSRHRVAVVLRVVARPSAWTRLGDWSTTLVLAGGVGVVLLLLGGLLLEVQVLRPLAAVRQAADRVADGELDAAVPAEGPAEFAALATAFNRMTASLQHQIDRNAAQRASLLRAEQLASVGRLSAGVAHEVGNPLAAILGYVELLLDPRNEADLADEQRALLQRCRAQLERIQDIVGQLLDYSRPPRGESQPLPIYEAIERLLSLLHHDPRCHDVQLAVFGDMDSTAEIDPAHLDQVLQNLVVNGSRAASSEGHSEGHTATVEIEVQTLGGDVVIDVRDSGPGVPDDLRPQIFEPFFTTAAAGEGTGLGLAICRGLVEGMGGTLVCLPHKDQPPLRTGQQAGATFRLTIPSRADSRRQEPTEAPNSAK